MELLQSLTYLQQQSISIVRATSVVNNFGAQVASSGTGISKLANGMQQYVKAAEKGMEISDTYTNISSKLSMITSGASQFKSLQNDIFAAADRARGSYTDMAGTVGKLGSIAGQQFGGNKNVVRFTETMQKMFRIGGTPATKQSGDMAQVQQDIGSGRLQGQNFSALTQDAPMVETAIAKYMKKSGSDVQQLGTDGKITSQVLINSILNYSGTVDQQMGKMSYTWSDYWNKITNGAYQAFGGVFSCENSMLGSNGAKSAVNGIVGSFSILAAIASGVLTGIANVGGFIAQNWSVIAPIIAGVVAALLIYSGAMLMNNMLTGIQTAGTAMAAIAAVAHGATLSVEAVAQTGMTSAQIAFNAALYACPLTWILLIIIAIIAVIYIVVAIIDNVTGQTISATGIIGGIIGTLAAYLYNIFVFYWNFIAAFVNFFGNVFTNPVASIKALFFDLASSVIGFFQTMAKGIEALINKIPGVHVDITSGLNGLENNLKKASATVKSNAGLKTYMQTKGYEGYSDAASKGYSVGQGIDKSVKGLFDSKTPPLPKTPPVPPLPPTPPLGTAPLGMAQNPVAVTGTGTGGAVEVNIADQDLQYLRDLAEKSYINKFSTAVLSPKISVNIEGSGNTTSDKNLSKRISNILQNQISTAAEGNYI